VADPIDVRLTTLEARIAQLEGRLCVATAAAPPAPRSDGGAALEAKLGAYWLSRIGIVSLISGAAFAILTHFAELGPVVRIALGYATAGVVAWLGLRLARVHPTFGRIVFGGGLAIAYFVTYALHFVAALRVIDSEPLGIALVAAAIAAIVVIAHRMQSETVAGIALFLGFHTGLLSEVTALSLVTTSSSRRSPRRPAIARSRGSAPGSCCSRSASRCARAPIAGPASPRSRSPRPG
jgi:hypothetical protein